MKLTMRNLSLVFAAGCWGALWNSLAVWVFGALGIAPALGVHIAPALTPAFLYPRLVWGGLWGLLFLLPLGRLSFPVRGLLFFRQRHRWISSNPDSRRHSPRAVRPGRWTVPWSAEIARPV